MIPSTHSKLDEEFTMNETIPRTVPTSIRRHSLATSSNRNSKIIRTLLIIMLAISIIPPQASASQIELAWDANPESSKTAGYRVYYSRIPGQYKKDQMKDVGKATHCTIDLSDGNWYFVVSAYDTKGNESSYPAR
jgi:hypothetical protein